MRSIGLDIGEYSVKLVELVQNKKNVTINQIQEKPLTPNATAEDRELEVIEFVRGVLSNTELHQARWVLAVRQDQATTRHKSFPFSDRLKIQKSLSFEMEEDIPFHTDACIFDAKTIHTQGASADVLATAVPKGHIAKLIDMASSFGVEIHIISVEGLAYANLVEEWYNPPPENPEPITLNEETKPVKNIQVLLNIGHRRTLFTAFENNRLVFTRSLFWGSQQLLNMIVKKYEISYAEALHMLRTQGAILLNKENSSFEQAQFSDSICLSLMDLVRDLQMSFIELQSEFNANITGVHLTGGGSIIRNLGGYLTQHLETPCNPIYLLQNYVSSGSSLSSPEQAYDIETRFTTAVAIGLEAFKKSLNPATNLFKAEFAKQQDALKDFWKRWGTVTQVGTAALITLFIWTSFRQTFTFGLNEKVEELISTQAKNVARLPKKQANESGVKKYIRDHKKTISELKKISQVAQMNSALSILKNVSEAAPAKNALKVDIMTFQVKDEFVQILGYANSQEEVTSLSQSLKSVSSDGIVTQLPSPLTPVANRVSFNISFKTDRGLIK